MRCDGKGQRDDEGGADPNGALDINGPVHLIDESFDDGHAQAGPVVDASGIRAFLGEGVKNMLQKRLAHADAGV